MKAFFDAYRREFGPLTQKQVDGLNEILGFLAADPWPSTAHMAYFLATTKWECGDEWHPIVERGREDYFRKYEPNTRIGIRLGNTQAGDGARFKGRGYVQITGRRNYSLFATLLRLPLLSDPDIALRPEVAYRIAKTGMLGGLFTGAKAGTYLDRDPPDFINARRVINGTDRASEIADYARQFMTILSSPFGA